MKLVWVGLLFVCSIALIFFNWAEQSTISNPSSRNPFVNVLEGQYRKAVQEFRALSNPSIDEYYNFAILSLSYAETELGEVQKSRDTEVSSRAIVGFANAIKNRAKKEIEKQEIVEKFVNSKEMAKLDAIEIFINLAKEGNSRSITELASYYTHKNDTSKANFWKKAAYLAGENNLLNSSINFDKSILSRPLDEEILEIEKEMSFERILSQEKDIFLSLADGLICRQPNDAFGFAFRKLGNVFTSVTLHEENNELYFIGLERTEKQLYRAPIWVEKRNEYRLGGESINRRTLEYKFEPTKKDLEEFNRRNELLSQLSGLDGDNHEPITLSTKKASCKYYPEYSNFLSSLEVIKQIKQDEINEELRSNKF